MQVGNFKTEIYKKGNPCQIEIRHPSGSLDITHEELAHLAFAVKMAQREVAYSYGVYKEKVL